MNNKKYREVYNPSRYFCQVFFSDGEDGGYKFRPAAK